MDIYVKCYRCKREGKPTQSVSVSPLSGMSSTIWTAPNLWQEIDTHLFCSSCVKKVRAAMMAVMETSNGEVSNDDAS